MQYALFLQLHETALQLAKRNSFFCDCILRENVLRDKVKEVIEVDGERREKIKTQEKKNREKKTDNRTLLQNIAKTTKKNSQNWKFYREARYCLLHLLTVINVHFSPSC
jgi:hypothetical protein